MPVQQVAAGPLQVNPVELTTEELASIQSQVETLKKLLYADKKVKAKYKIEIFFGKARSLLKSTPGAISFWESGSKLHGGGDAKLYICPGSTLRQNNCEAFIPDVNHGLTFLVCPHCGCKWTPDQVHGEILANLTMKQWAQALGRYFTRLEMDCDIYLKHAPDDIRSVAAAEQERQRKGELLTNARDRRIRATHIYPLHNIIKDLSSGADPLVRFHAFLTV